MTPEREKAIRAAWEANREDGAETLKRADRFCVPYPVKARIVPRPEALDPTMKVDVLEYHIEHAVIDRQPMSRVVCEGVEVEIFRRPSTVLE